MKLLSLFTAALIGIFLFTGLDVQAQREASIFDSKTSFEGLENVESLVQETFTIPTGERQSLKLLPEVDAKRLGIPRPTKTTKGHITLKKDGVCYRFGCQKAESCSDCTLGWWDRNNDGKVQPRRELRCFCTDGKKCRVRVRKKDC